ncbi:unnamed protein product [Rotaria magnacalcarata]|uniref:Xaa-Pro dipeptidase n=1 Tax=Rotaria magnacalcarata TaxID=392030 RepID=A0A814GHK5_9BILA|nr:unnamed protein product [Rotaria magnacalcarata]CAF1235874.1 unnamed protein product [Rotaria magnacalcarata]CAF1906518.1 unnamed protein product [Rotaria magnacalcarata]CAF1935056.1 unnamed protein product [Rotaria magnacalcarata]CAF1972717.1 unnamed protein product [Rotaria magnacalcarata]
MVTFSDSDHFWKGGQTLKVPMELFKENRQRLCEVLRCHRTLPPDSFVLLQGGKSEMRYCSDHEPLFRQESYFHWAFGVIEPDFYGAINVQNNESMLFIPRLPSSYVAWMGKIKETDEFKQIYHVDHVYYADELEKVFSDLVGASKLILVLNGLNTDSGTESKAAHFDGIEKFHVDKTTLHPVISECRVLKTDLELNVLRYTNKMSSEAHKFVMLNIKDGMYEYELESLFQYYCHRYGAMRHMSYTCICATGENPAVLHYGHAGAPNDRRLTANDMCLFDMGGEYCCYASDITCSFPVSGTFTKEQRIIYEAVLDANRQVMKSVHPNVSWIDMHLLAERTQLEHLKLAGLVQGDIEEMMDARLGAIFMPHGLGHMLGIDTHDVGGYLEPHTRSTLPGLKSLRTNRLLKERMCLTIEPGIYFNQALLNGAYENERLNKFLNKTEIDKYLHIGGVRIEDNIFITKDGCELLTKVPRSCEEIEEWMKNNKKQSNGNVDYELFDELNQKYQYENQYFSIKKNN